MNGFMKKLKEEICIRGLETLLQLCQLQMNSWLTNWAAKGGELLYYSG